MELGIWRICHDVQHALNTFLSCSWDSDMFKSEAIIYNYKTESEKNLKKGDLPWQDINHKINRLQT